MKLHTSLMLLFCLFLFACTGINNTAPKEKPALNEPFDPFFKKFESDSIFQKSRVKFPLKLIVTGDEGDKDSIKYIPQADWKFENLLVNQQEKSIVKKYRISDNEMRIQFQMEDTGIQTERFFKRKNGAWWLVLVKDESD